MFSFPTLNKTNYSYYILKPKQTKNKTKKVNKKLSKVNNAYIKIDPYSYFYSFLNNKT